MRTGQLLALAAPIRSAFLAGMVGFCLTGDIFDMFVWFEVMSVAAYALTAYRPEERGSLQGGLNFAISNSLGAYLTLSGIGPAYGRTGALNLAQIGADLSRHQPDWLVVVAFLFILAGLLTKSAIVRFHFWLADAHAAAIVVSVVVILIPPIAVIIANAGDEGSRHR